MTHPVYVFDSHADLCLIPPESIPFKPESVRIKHGLLLHPGIRIEINSADPKSESESIPPLNDRFRVPMFQSGLFVPNRSAPDVIFTATGDFTAMPVARSHIYSYI